MSDCTMDTNETSASEPSGPKRGKRGRKEIPVPEDLSSLDDRALREIAKRKRNRENAQASRQRKAQEWAYLRQRVEELEEDNAAKKAEIASLRRDLQLARSSASKGPAVQPARLAAGAATEGKEEEEQQRELWHPRGPLSPPPQHPSASSNPGAPLARPLPRRTRAGSLPPVPARAGSQQSSGSGQGGSSAGPACGATSAFKPALARSGSLPANLDPLTGAQQAGRSMLLVGGHNSDAHTIAAAGAALMRAGCLGVHELPVVGAGQASGSSMARAGSFGLTDVTANLSAFGFGGQGLQPAGAPPVAGMVAGLDSAATSAAGAAAGAEAEAAAAAAASLVGQQGQGCGHSSLSIGSEAATAQLRRHSSLPAAGRKRGKTAPAGVPATSAPAAQLPAHLTNQLQLPSASGSGPAPASSPQLPAFPLLAILPNLSMFQQLSTAMQPASSPSVVEALIKMAPGSQAGTTQQQPPAEAGPLGATGVAEISSPVLLPQPLHAPGVALPSSSLGTNILDGESGVEADLLKRP
ncbi:hypothetical protein N2152v2_007361 [Parachlorella kessleri]